MSRLADESTWKARRAAQRRRRRRAQASRLSWLAMGVLLGLAAGLYYTWVVDPVVFVNASPARLRADYQEEYLFLVSQGYAADGDLVRAQRRLAALLEEEPGERATINELVSAELERYLREVRRAEYVVNMARLAADLGVDSAAVAYFAPALATGTAVAIPPPPSPTATPSPTASPTVPPTSTPTATATAVPTLTPTATPRPVFQLLGQERVCQRDEPVDRIEIIVVDAELAQLPGVEVQVHWDAGSDFFYTGFKPQLGLGYADFTMSPDSSYSLFLTEGSPTVSGLRIEPCPPADGGLPGGWRLTFQDTTLPTPTPTPVSSDADG